MDGFLGAAYARLGKRDLAIAADSHLAGWTEPYAFGAPTFWRARIAVVLGEPDRAVRLLRQAFSEGAVRNISAP